MYLLRSDQFLHLSFLCLRMKLEHPILHRSKLPSFSRLMIEDLMRERSNSCWEMCVGTSVINQHMQKKKKRKRKRESERDRCSKYTLFLIYISVQFSSVTQLCLTLWPHRLQYVRIPCPSPAHGACSNSCPSSRWCHPTIYIYFTLFLQNLTNLYLLCIIFVSGTYF